MPMIVPASAAGAVDSTTWAALALVLTVVGAALSFAAWRRRGLAAGLRGLAWTLVPVAAWLTGTLRLAAGIVEDVVDWAARLVFSPTVWLGVIVAAVAVGLWVLSGVMRARGIGVRDAPKRVRAGSGDRAAAPVTGRKGSAPKAAPQDDDMAEIEAILKKHGI